MKKRRVCVVVFSRANYGRIKSFLIAADSHPNLELFIIVGASALLSRFGNVSKLIEDDGFSIASVLYSIVEGETPSTMAKSTGLSIIELSTHFENIKPDIVLSVADRYETLATVVAASYMNIPVAHTQGGEVTGSIDESVRHAITKLSHIHFPATERAASYIAKMGEDISSIHLTGCPAMDLISKANLTIKPDFFVNKKGSGLTLDPQKPYLVVLQHPVTTEYESAIHQIEQTIIAVDHFAKKGMQIVWLWPNIDAGSDSISKAIRIYRENSTNLPIRFYKNFSPEDYLILINNTECLIGNSSSGIREGSFLGVPAVNIGSRQSDRERGANVIDCPYDSSSIIKAIDHQLEHGRYNRDPIYGDGTAGKLIADVLATADLSINKRLSYLN